MRSAFWPNAFRLPLTTESLGKECCAGQAGQGGAEKPELSQGGWRGGEWGVG